MNIDFGRAQVTDPSGVVKRAGSQLSFEKTSGAPRRGKGGKIIVITQIKANGARIAVVERFSVIVF